ncbi:MAG: hypothetical protein DHS20C16_32540 [Phycisphaerae bacterium]|nr:MAG: hypothetical protein DHS20C16_32540 [Phycisphaerae bacterium]
MSGTSPGTSFGPESSKDADTQAAVSRYLGSVSLESLGSLGSMEGIYETIVETSPPRVTDAAKVERAWPGMLLSAIVAAAAVGVHYLPFPPFLVERPSGIARPISAAIIAIVAGLLFRNFGPWTSAATAGCKKIIKKVIPIAIVLTGAKLNLIQLKDVGAGALATIVICIAVAILSAVYLGKLLGLGKRVALLIGVGTGICGNSAIVAVAPLIEADDEDLVLSIGTVNLFGLIAMLVLPAIGAMIDISDSAFGIWAGTSVHAVPQAVAAGYAFSFDAGTMATLAKLVRVALLAPLVCVLAIYYARRHSSPADRSMPVVIHYARFVPWFVWGFALMATLGTLGLIPTLMFSPADSVSGWGLPGTVSLMTVFAWCGKMLLIWAMAAIGLEVNVRVLGGVSGKAILCGLGASVVLGVVSLLLVFVFT